MCHEVFRLSAWNSGRMASHSALTIHRTFYITKREYFETVSKPSQSPRLPPPTAASLMDTGSFSLQATCPPPTERAYLVKENFSRSAPSIKDEVDLPSALKLEETTTTAANASHSTPLHGESPFIQRGPQCLPLS